MTGPLKLLANAATRRLDLMFPGYFAQAKHNHYRDFGYPTEVTFDQAYSMYERNGFARAAIEKTVGKTWQDSPFLQDHQRDGTDAKDDAETKAEADIRQRFDDLRLWQRLAECDRRSMVGAYSGLILRLADNKTFREPVDRVPGGLAGLAEVIPAWEGQLTVAEWDTDERSEGYGHPKMYQFTESKVGDTMGQPRQFQIHPDRVLIWSKDGAINGSSTLRPGFNALLTLEKIVGAGGEGFWKNAKSAPVLEMDKDANLEAMAKAMGVAVDDVTDKLDQQVGDWNRGFDQSLMVQGMRARALQVTLPSPEHFFAVALQEFAGSMSIPLKIMVGSQTGERASTEDAQEWAHTNMSRRTGQVIPNTMGLVRRLERFGILPAMDWFLSWTDLTEASMAEKIDRAAKMAEVNSKMATSGEPVFTHEEIREVVGFEPLSDAEKYRADETDNQTNEEAAALGAG